MTKEKKDLFAPYEVKDLELMMSKIATDLKRLQRLTHGKPTDREIDRIRQTAIDRNTGGKVIAEMVFSYMPIELWKPIKKRFGHSWHSKTLSTERGDKLRSTFWKNYQPDMGLYALSEGSFQAVYHFSNTNWAGSNPADPGGVYSHVNHEVGESDVFAWGFGYQHLNARYYDAGKVFATRQLKTKKGFEVFFHEGEKERIKRHYSPGIVNFIGDCMGIWKAGSSKAGTILKG